LNNDEQAESQMSESDDKSPEQQAYERGQKTGAHGNVLEQVVNDYGEAMGGSDSEYASWKAGLDNGLANSPEKE
jgi:hypothetical protein